MKAALALFFALASSGWAIQCPTLSTSLSSTVGGGNASAGATWTGGTAPASNANGYCLTIQGPVVLDTDWGTNGGTGVYTIIQSGSGSLSVNTSAARHIYFASTGSNPIGTGTAASPNASATMFGFFFPTGTLSLVGTSTNKLTITSANGASPWYLGANESQTNSGFTLAVKWCACSLLGGNTAGFYGLYVDAATFTGTETIDVENNQFTNYYSALYVNSIGLGAGKLTVANNIFTGRTGPQTIGGTAFPSPTITGNTESAPAASGTFVNVSGLSGSAVSYQQNAVFGSTSFGLGNLQVTTGFSATGGTISGNSTQNAPVVSAVGITTNFATGFNLAVTGTYAGAFDRNYCETCYIAVELQMTPASSFSIANNFATGVASTSGTGPAQGIYFNNSGHLTMTGNVGLFVTSTTINANQCIFLYDGHADSSTTTVITNNTCGLAVGVANLNFYAMNIGDNQSYGVSGILMAKNLIVGYQYGMYDNALGMTGNVNAYVTSCPGGVGMCQNDIWQATTSYLLETGISVNIGTGHPNPAYGDQTLEPAFLDSSRYQIATYDSRALGGPGTVADFATQLGYRSGWGGTYTLSSTPIVDMVNWDRAGFTPGNGLVCAGAGGQIGAVPCVTAATAMAPTQ
jgi:hypothetical protein